MDLVPETVATRPKQAPNTRDGARNLAKNDVDRLWADVDKPKLSNCEMPRVCEKKPLHEAL